MSLEAEGHVGVSKRIWFTVVTNMGAPDPGQAANLLVSIRNPANTTTVTPAVTESGLAGMYFVDFTPTALGDYGIIFTKTTAPRSTNDGILHASLDLLPYNDGRHVAVHFDSSAGNTNTDVGVDGTISNPVSTEAAALTIAAALGINAFHISGVIFLGVAHTEATFYGSGAGTLLFNSKSTSKCVFEDLTLIGDAVFSANLTRDCRFSGVTNFAGDARRCEFIGSGIPCSISGSDFVDCRTVGSGTVRFSFAGTNQPVVFRDFVGDVTIEDMDTAGINVQFGLGAGRVTVDPTCTSGDLVLSGIATLADNSAGTAVDAASLVSDATVARSTYGGAVWIDTVSGNPGTTVGVHGHEGNPVSTFADAQAIAAAIGAKELRFSGDATLVAPLNGFTVIRHGGAPSDSRINLGSQNVNDSRFVGCELLGTSG